MNSSVFTRWSTNVWTFLRPSPHAERLLRSVREECTNRIMLFDRGHAERIPNDYAEHFNTHLPHHGRNQLSGSRFGTNMQVGPRPLGRGPHLRTEKRTTGRRAAGAHRPFRPRKPRPPGFSRPCSSGIRPPNTSAAHIWSAQPPAAAPGAACSPVRPALETVVPLRLLPSKRVGTP